MYWDNIINELSKYGTVEIWEDEFIVVDGHNDIAGVKLWTDKGNLISIISHKYSYGGTRHLFEIMPGIENDVDGYLTESQVIEKIHQLLKIN